MVRLLIVDDEPNVSEGLAYDICWDEVGVDEVVPLNSAQRAAELVERRAFQVVITDVKMPGIDGMELARRIEKRWGQVRIVFISGYDEFEYARQAIGVGAFAYLTKPLYYPTVRATVQDALADLAKEVRQSQALQDARERLDTYLPMVKERLLFSWVVRRAIAPDRNGQRFKDVGIHLDAGDHVLVVLLRRDEQGGQTAGWRVSAEAGLDALVEHMLLRGKDGHVFRDDEENAVVLCAGSRAEVAETTAYLKEVSERFLSALRYATGAAYSIFWEWCACSADVPTCYQRALERSRLSLRWGSGIIEGPGPVSESTTVVASLSAYPRLGFLIENLQLERALERVDTIFAELRHTGAATHDSLLHVYTLVCYSLSQASQLRGIPLTEWLGDLVVTFHRFDGVRSGQALHDWARTVISRYVEFVSGSEDHTMNQVVERAKRVIAERLGEEMTLSDIAAEAFVHPNYLCALFKRTEGVSVGEYTTILRIDEAKRRLKLPGARVCAVADELGYKSLSHFNRVFRRLVGCTPKEYQLHR
jgi:two-component system response regulator YesN